MAVGAEAVTEAPSFWASFLKLLPFMLVCGIVGAIFLVGYFAFDEPGTEWMLGWGIAIVVMDVGLAASVAWLSHRGQARLHRLGTSGRRARADILAMEQTRTQINDQPVMRLQLRIHGPDLSPFEVSARKVVPISMLPLLHRGSLAVLADPETQEWEIDWQGTAAQPGGEIGAGVPVARPAPSTEDRLRELDGLRTKELITEEEYAACRRRILDEI